MGNQPPQRTPAASPPANGGTAALQRQLEAAEAALRASEAGRVQEREARVAAEAALRAAERESFFYRMRGICSSSAADSTSNSDEARRGAPSAVEVPLDTLIDGAGVSRGVSASAAAAAWAAFTAAHTSEWGPPPDSDPLDENCHVHPTIARLLRPLVPPHLRLWGNVITVDDVPRAEIKPDFTLTHARDAMPSLLGGVLLVEVKLPGCIDQAKAQAIIYARRRMLTLYCECMARGEPLHELQAFALATDGREVVIVRVRSGAPPPGGTFDAAAPCPAEVSAGLPLLGAWDFRAQPVLPTAPPAALPVLLQLLAQQALLGPEAPMASVCVELTREGGGQGGPQALELTLSERLGLGGTSDAYLLEGSAVSDGGSGGSSSGGVVLKVARHTSDAVRACFERECIALRVLAELAASGGPVPRLLGQGWRVGLNKWPVLLLEPMGLPLSRWMERACKAAVAGSGGRSRAEVAAAAAAVRVRCATLVALDILGALEAAHASSIIHCDVRPSNIVVRESGRAVLIDWGLSRAEGTPCSGCGVAAFADERVFLNSTYSARPAQDLCALLCTWLAAVHSAACDSPWVARGRPASEALYTGRRAWLTEACRGSGGVAGVAALLNQLQVRSGSTAAQQHGAVRVVLEGILANE